MSIKFIHSERNTNTIGLNILPLAGTDFLSLMGK